MCGRFPQALTAYYYRRAVTPQLPQHRAPRQTRGSDDYRASHNVAPNTMVPVIRCVLEGEDVSDAEGGIGVRYESTAEESDETSKAEEEQSVKPESSEDSKPAVPLVVMQTMKWGLLPPHMKTLPGPGEAMRTINARSDVLLSGSPLWSRPFNKGQRCVVFVQGFYEWLKRPRGGNPNNVDRIPHFIGLDEEGLGRVDRNGNEKKLMALGGLWEKTHLKDESEPRYTFTIITTDVGPQLDFLHDRQPLILPDENAIETWLNPNAPLAQVKKLLQIYDGPLEFYKVPKEVGKVGNDDKGFMLPVEERKDGLMAAFGRGSKAGKVSAKGDDGARVEDANSETNAPVKVEEKERDARSSQGEDSIGAKELIDATQQAEEAHEQKTVKSEPSNNVKSEPHQTSSRFSPDPFNPPISPNRPNGGYSNDEDPQGGLTKYGRSGWEEESHGSSKKRVAMGEGVLEKQFKKQKVVEEFEREAGISAKQASPPKTPSKKSAAPAGHVDGSHSRSPPTSAATSAKSKSQSGKNKNGAGGADIRSFFAKSP